MPTTRWPKRSSWHGVLRVRDTLMCVASCPDAGRSGLWSHRLRCSQPIDERHRRVERGRDSGCDVGPRRLVQARRRQRGRGHRFVECRRQRPDELVRDAVPDVETRRRRRRDGLRRRQQQLRRGHRDLGTRALGTVDGCDLGPARQRARDGHEVPPGPQAERREPADLLAVGRSRKLRAGEFEHGLGRLVPRRVERLAHRRGAGGIRGRSVGPRRRNVGRHEPRGVRRRFAGSDRRAGLDAVGDAVPPGGTPVLAFNPCCAEFLDGALDEVRIYDRALSAVDIAQLHAAP